MDKEHVMFETLELLLDGFETVLPIKNTFYGVLIEC